MNEAQPIKDLVMLQMVKDYYKGRSPRNSFLIFLALNTGLRVGDLLKLRVVDVKNQTHIFVKEEKTRKSKRIKINDYVGKEIDNYIVGMEEQDYLFKSREGVNKCLTREMAFKIIRDAGRETGFQTLSPHSLRKTFGYWFYKRNKDIAWLQKFFQHSSPSITMRYIGMDQEELDKGLDAFAL